MAVNKFSKKQAISFGFEKAKKNWKFFIPVVLITLLFNYSPKVGPQFHWSPGQYFDQNMIPLALAGFTTAIIVWLLRQIIEIGKMVIALKFVDNKKAELADLLTYKPLLNYVLGSILFGIIVVAGIILFIIPGVIWALKLQFYGYLIVDKKMGPVEALKKSWQITKGVKWQLFLLSILLGLIDILGFLALGIGSFITIPTTMIAGAYVYRKLSS